MKVDLHTHYGRVLRNKKNEDLLISPESYKKYIYENEITHVATCYYYRSEIEAVMSICPDVKIYPIQWITTENDTINADINKGIKLHSHRGSDFNPLQQNIGLDYNGNIIKKILEKLEPNQIVQYHMQSSASPQNSARGQSIQHLAFKFKPLKHQLVHGGAFGLKTMYTDANEKYYDAFNCLALGAELLVKEACFFADRLSNIFIDSSILISKKHFKTDLIAKCSKSGFGTDFPYCNSLVGSMLKQERIIRELYGQELVDIFHKRSLSWLEEPLGEFTITK